MPAKVPKVPAKIFCGTKKKVLRLFQSLLVFAGTFREMPRYICQGTGTGASNSYFRQICLCLFRVLLALFICAVEGFCRHNLAMPRNLFLAQTGNIAETISWHATEMPLIVFAGIS
jgi:hypothetical protein